ncbi:MAG: class I SAM-dependent methyltransferase [Nanoarchaeota archaeon]
MKLSEIKKNFEIGAKENPLNTVLTEKKQWDSSDFFRDGISEIGEVRDYLKKNKLNIGKKRVLDFGCGVGRLTQALAPFFKESYGVDISENMIKKAREYNKFGNKCKYLVNVKDNLRIFPDDHFDFIYSSITLQHISQKYSLRYIKEFLRILKPEGLIIFQIPSRRIIKPGENRLKYLVKGAILKIAPESFINYSKKARGMIVINMYPIKRERLVDFISQNNGEVIDVIKDKWNNGRRYESLRYTIRKK